MKFLFILGAFALVAGAFAAKDSEMISRGKKLVSEAENWRESLKDGPDPHRYIMTAINDMGIWDLNRMIEKMESGSELSQSEKDEFNHIEKRMAEEKKVYKGIFEGKEAEPTGETLINAAEAMIKDAESKDLTAEQKKLVADLQQNLKNHESWGFQTTDGGMTLTSMVKLNEVTNFY